MFCPAGSLRVSCFFAPFRRWFPMSSHHPANTYASSISLSFYFPVFISVMFVCQIELISISIERNHKNEWTSDRTPALLCVCYARVCIVGLNFLINNKQITLFVRSVVVLAHSITYCCLFFFRFGLGNGSLRIFIYIHITLDHSVFSIIEWLCVCLPMKFHMETA